MAWWSSQSYIKIHTNINITARERNKNKVLYKRINWDCAIWWWRVAKFYYKLWNLICCKSFPFIFLLLLMQHTWMIGKLLFFSFNKFSLIVLCKEEKFNHCWINLFRWGSLCCLCWWFFAVKCMKIFKVFHIESFEKFPQSLKLSTILS